MAAPCRAVASYQGHPPGSQPPTALTQGISEHTHQPMQNLRTKMPVQDLFWCLHIVKSQALVWGLSAVLGEVGVTVGRNLVVYLWRLLLKG